MRTGTPFIANAKPEVTVGFFDITPAAVGSTYTSSDRILYAWKLEEPYTGKGKIHLLNDDGALDALNFLGCLTVLTWGWDGGTASFDEPIWVVNQKTISVEGKVVTELDCISAWELMEHSRGVNAASESDMQTPAYGISRLWDRSKTILEIITEIAQATGSFLEQWGLDTITHLSDDSIIDSYEPLFFSRLNDDDRTLIRRLLQMTLSGMTIRAATGPTINYINASLPGPYYTYQNDNIEHPFFINIFGDSISIPNYIIAVDQEPNPTKNEEANWVGSAVMPSTPLGVFGYVLVDPTIEDNTEASKRAFWYLRRIVAETKIGELFVPMNCCAELYDEIEIIDARTSTTKYGRIGSIERIYKGNGNGLVEPSNQRDIYTCMIKLGGIGGGSTRVESLAAGINDIETTISDFKGRSLTNPFIDTPQVNGAALTQHLAPELYVDTCSSNTAVSSGTITDITGCTRDLTPNPFGPNIVARVTADVFLGSVAAIGDACNIYLYLEGAQYGQPISMIAASISDGKPLSKSWYVPLVADGTTYTLTLRVQRQSGVGTWSVIANLSEMRIEIFNSKNLVVS